MDQIEYVTRKIPYFAMAPAAKLNKYSNVRPTTVVNLSRSYMMAALLYGA